MKILNTRLTCLLMLTLVVLSNQASLARMSKHRIRTEHGSRSERKAKRLVRLRSSSHKMKKGFWDLLDDINNVVASGVAGFLLGGIIVAVTSISGIIIIPIGTIIGVVLYYIGDHVAHIILAVLAGSFSILGMLVSFMEVRSSISKKKRTLSHRSKKSKSSSTPPTDEELKTKVKETLQSTIISEENGEKKTIQTGSNGKSITISEKYKLQLKKQIEEDFLLIYKNIKELKCSSALEKGNVRILFFLNNMKAYDNLNYIQMLRMNQFFDSKGNFNENIKDQKKVYSLKSEAEQDTVLSINIYTCQDKKVGFMDNQQNFQELGLLFDSLENNKNFNELKDKTKKITFLDIMKKEQVQLEILKLSNGDCCKPPTERKKRRHNHFR